MQWLGWPLKNMPLPICVTMLNFIVFIIGVVINTGEPPNWGALELCILGMGGVADPKIHAHLPRVTTSDLVVLWQRVYAQIEGNPKTGKPEPRPHRRGLTSKNKALPLSRQCSDQLLVTTPFLSLHRGHGTAYHLPSQLFHPSPPFSNNWRHICLGSVFR